MIPPEVRACWDPETLAQVESALKSLPKDLHPAVFYVGGAIASARSLLVTKISSDEVEGMLDILKEYGIESCDVHEVSVDICLAEQEMLNNLIKLLDALIQADYAVAHSFFQERLRVSKVAMSLTAVSSDDFKKAKAYLQRSRLELDLLENIVVVLSRYTRAPLH